MEEVHTKAPPIPANSGFLESPLEKKIIIKNFTNFIFF